eukprot:scaffold1829_cov194-Ochromonas_danica.AAC.23
MAISKIAGREGQINPMQQQEVFLLTGDVLIAVTGTVTVTGEGAASRENTDRLAENSGGERHTAARCWLVGWARAITSGAAGAVRAHHKAECSALHATSAQPDPQVNLPAN